MYMYQCESEKKDLKALQQLLLLDRYLKNNKILYSFILPRNCTIKKANISDYIFFKVCMMVVAMATIRP